MKLISLIAVVIQLIGFAGALPARAEVPNPEQVFTPIAPCRVFDSSKSTPLRAQIARDVYVNGTFKFPSQGGPAGGCSIPASATAVAVSLASSDTTAAGHILTSAPGKAGFAIIMGLVAHQTQVANAVANIGGHRFILHPSAGSTNLTADITGYYAPHIAAYISPDGTIYSSTSRVLSSTHNSTGSYAITIDRDVSFCAASVNIAGGAYYGDATFSDDKILVTTWSLSSTAASVLQDLYFQISVQC